MDTPVLWSVGEIAEKTSEPLHRVTYAINSRSIEPTLIAGGRRLFDAGAVELIKHALSMIQLRKEVRDADL